VRAVLRLFVSFITAVATYYFVFWVGGALLFGDELPYATAWLVSLTLACLIGLLVWTQTARPNPGLGRAAALFRELAFRRMVAPAGGMRAWRDADLPLAHDKELH
jgi:hypothetical protein